MLRKHYPAVIALLSGVICALDSRGATDIYEPIASPFIPTVSAQPVAQTDSAQPLELRGVVFEGKVAWLTFFDPATKIWTTVREGESSDSLSLKTYDRSREIAEVEVKNERFLVGLKAAAGQSFGRSSIASVTVEPVIAPQRAMVPGPSPAEAKRFEEVASIIRQRIEQQKTASDSGIASRS